MVFMTHISSLLMVNAISGFRIFLTAQTDDLGSHSAISDDDKLVVTR